MKKNLLTFAVLFLSLNIIKAQDFPYAFSVETGTYTDLTNSTDLTMNAIWDDPFYVAPIGFDFEFFGETTDSLYNFNYVGAWFYTDINAEIPLDALIAYGNDLIDRGAIDYSGPLSPISYVTEGTTPNRIFKLEYKNAGFFNEIDQLYSNDNFVNFQLWIYEGSNDFEIHFGASNFDEPQSEFDDFPGGLIGILENFSIEEDTLDYGWLLADNPFNPEPEPLTNEDINNFDLEVLNGHPVDGTIYRFSTSIVSVNNVAFEESFKLFPTLVEQNITLEINDASWIDEDATIQIIDNHGRVGFTQQTTVNDNMQLDLGALASGMYHLTFFTKAANLSRKFIKQ